MSATSSGSVEKLRNSATQIRTVPQGTVSVRVRDVNHFYGEGELAKQVLFDNDLELHRGEIVIMTGPSGSGKTTLLTLIGGLRGVQSGSVEVKGRELRGLSQAQLTEVRRDIGFIFQAHNLFLSLTAMQNVRMALELREDNARVIEDRAREMLTLLGLGERLDYKPQKLSGGQRQRVAIARALVNRPSVILADEPTAALDKQSGRDVVDLLKRFANDHGCTILMVTHDNRILDVADRIVNMVDGRIISNVVVDAAAAIIEFLRCCTLFKDLPTTTLTSIADQMTLERASPNDAIVKQGDPGNKFYVIRKGEARVVVRDAQGERQVAELKEGEFFGETALLTGAPRNATVTAKTELELYSLDKAAFQRAIEIQSFNGELRRALFARQGA